MDVIDFVRESSKYMVKVRPDFYTAEDALLKLYDGLDALREVDASYSAYPLPSFILHRMFGDGVEELMLTEKISGMILVEEEEASKVFAYSRNVDLPNIHDSPTLDDDL